MSAADWDFEPTEREHDCCPRCGRGSCPGSGSLGWDGCEEPVWIPVSTPDSWTGLPCPHDNTDHRGDGCLHCGCDVPQ